MYKYILIFCVVNFNITQASTVGNVNSSCVNEVMQNDTISSESGEPVGSENSSCVSEITQEDSNDTISSENGDIVDNTDVSCIDGVVQEDDKSDSTISAENNEIVCSDSNDTYKIVFSKEDISQIIKFIVAHPKFSGVALISAVFLFMMKRRLIN